MRLAPILVLAAALALGALALLRLNAGAEGLSVARVAVEGTPATLHWRDGAPPGPAVLIAHGFSGSARLMEAFALDLAQAGYLAVSYDALGHGRNPAPLSGDVAREDGATERLLAEMATVAQWARAQPQSDGRIAVLGHSMAADIVVRHAQRHPETQAVVAVSMFSPVVTADSPRNLLVVVGALEGGLTDEAVRVLRLTAGPEAGEGETFGDFDSPGFGARRVVFADGVEHVGVLFATESLREARGWLDAAFGRTSDAAPPRARGPWIVALIAAAVAAAWPLSRLLPRLAEPSRAFGWRDVALIGGLPAVATPLILWPTDIRFLPIAVGDYLALHFALFGALMWLGLALRRGLPKGGVSTGRLALAALAAALFALVVVGGVIDQFVTSFAPTPERLPLFAALLPGTLLYFLADERLTRSGPPGAYAATKLLFLMSLALAVALNLPRLFFLIILAPPLVAFFAVFGLFSYWAHRRTGHWAVGGLANAAIFALAIAVTFPMVAG
ncbi:alpha/beta hydrolase [Rubrimonas sp.]|uniref:alpha/beta hydrolase n=1 Tax=Rubrimonas sp. TaxID=2036015 RepID=UPI002FDE6396